MASRAARYRENVKSLLTGAPKNAEVVAQVAEFTIQDTKLQCQKCMGGWAKRNEQFRIFIEKSQAEMEDIGQTISAESLVEAQLDMEIRSLQAGDERAGSDASQSNERCMDPAFLHSFLTSGADVTLIL